MSEFPSPSSPDEDPSRPGGLPAKRRSLDEGESGSEEPKQPISLEEMMERLQRSGSTEKGSSSGRRRRRSSSSTSEGRSSSRSHGEVREEVPDRSDGHSHPPDRSRTVLPPPRRQEREAPPARRTPRQTAAPQRSRRWIFWVTGLLFIVFLTWYGIRLLNRWRIEGEGFRVNVGRRLSEVADRRVSTGRFRQTGTDQLSTPVLSVQPALQDLLASATFANLSADFTPASSLADEWTVRSLRVQKIELAFNPARTLDEQNMWALQPAPVDRGITPREGFRLGMTSDPATVVVEEGRFDRLDLSWPGPDGKPETLTQLQGNFRTVDQTLQLEMAGGLLDTSAWPAFAVQQINARLTGTSLEILGARLGITAGHEVRVTGSAKLTPDGSLQLTADIAPLLLKHLLPDLWANVALGNFESTGAVWKSHFKSGPPASLSGPFRVKGFVLRGLPFVDKIASLLRKPELALLEFPLLTGQYEWTPRATSLTGLTATTADGLLRLKGKATVAPGEAVTAELVIEANEAYFAGLPDGASPLFAAGPDGWRTLAFTLGGREDAITDDIGINQPIIIQNRPAPAAVEIPRMTLPPGVVAPAASAPPPAVQSPPTAPVTPTRGSIPTPAPRQPSDAELERQFKDLLGR